MSNPNIPPGPGRPKGSKNTTTLDKEARRAIFDSEMSNMFLDKIKKARPEYLLDQFMGKAKETVDLNVIDFIFDKDETKINKSNFEEENKK